MNYRKEIGALLKYLPLVLVLITFIAFLYQGAIMITDTMERNIDIATNSLRIVSIIGIIGSMMVLDQFNIMLMGKTSNFVEDFYEESGQDFAVKYSELFGDSIFIMIIFLAYFLYAYTRNVLFLNISHIVAIVYATSAIIKILAMHIEIKTYQGHAVYNKLSNPITIPVLVFLMQLLVVQKNLVGVIWRNLYSPQNEVPFILSLIAVLCYLLFTAYSYFSNIYCLIGFAFVKRNIKKIQGKINLLLEERQKREMNLRNATKRIDEQTETVGLIKSYKLILEYCGAQIKNYIQERLCAILYLIKFAELEITKRLKVLLEPKQIKINSIRFLGMIAVLELLSLNLILFLYLETDSPCLKFFELLSTVIIIPVLLSWLSELKVKKND